MDRSKLACLAVLCLIPVSVNAIPYYGITLSIPAVAKDPAHVTGFQLMLSYDPQRFQWRRFNVYFDGGYTLYRDTAVSYHRSVSIYSLAPVVRYTFRRSCGPIRTYIELSIGAAWINHTRFDDRNLGMHYAFQDRLGFGAFVGSRQQFSLGFHAIHYSNAHLSSHNSGISVPVEIDLGYRFS